MVAELTRVVFRAVDRNGQRAHLHPLRIGSRVSAVYSVPLQIHQSEHSVVDLVDADPSA